jgi:hypothetical protein
MANVSLARIMYGSSEEVHVSTGVSAFPGLTAKPVLENSSNSAHSEETLGELLHRVWLNVSGKG